MPAARRRSQGIIAAHDAALPPAGIRPTAGCSFEVQCLPPSKEVASNMGPRSPKSLMSRHLTNTLYFALVSFAAMLAGGSDTRSIAEGHRQVTSEHYLPLKGAWREAARLRQGLVDLAGLPELQATGNVVSKGDASTALAASMAPTSLDRPAPLRQIEITAAEGTLQLLEQAPARQMAMLRGTAASDAPGAFPQDKNGTDTAKAGSMPPGVAGHAWSRQQISAADAAAVAPPVPTPTNPIPFSATTFDARASETAAWPDLPHLQPIPLPVLSLLPSSELKKLQTTGPTRPKAPPNKTKTIDTVETPKNTAKVQKEAPDEGAPALFVQRTSAKAEAPAAPRRDVTSDVHHRTFEAISQAAP